MTTNTTITSSPIAAQSVFSRPAALIGGAIGLVALTALATTLAVRAPSGTEAAERAPASTTLAAASPTAAAARSSTPPQAPADFPENTLPASKANPGAAAAATAKPVHAQRGSVQPAPSPQRSASVCASCGKVESVVAVMQKGEGTGLGVVGGAVVGGLLGSQIGGGSGKNVATVLGAVGGGVAGNEVEKRSRATTAYRVSVRMDDGMLRTVTHSTAPAVGQSVSIEGSTLRLRPASS